MNATPFHGPAIALVALGALALLAIVGMRLLPRMARARAESARGRALAEPAARLGLIAVPDDHLTDLPPFELLNTGTDRRPSNVLRGSMSGASVVVFDYAFTDATKPARRFRRLHYSPYFAGATVCCVKGAWLSLPQFVMEPLMKPILRHAEALVDRQFGAGRMASAVHAMMQAAERMVHEVLPRPSRLDRRGMWRLAAADDCVGDERAGRHDPDWRSREDPRSTVARRARHARHRRSRNARDISRSRRSMTLEIFRAAVAR